MIATIELTDLQLSVGIGEHNAAKILPEIHVLNLVLTVNSDLVCTDTDTMSDVFDYDPILDFIYNLTKGKRYETQECLIFLIVRHCAQFDEVMQIDVSIRKESKGEARGRLGVRLVLNEHDVNKYRYLPSK